MNKDKNKSSKSLKAHRNPRAVAHPGTSVGRARYNLYREAFGHINPSIDEGFYLEAITLVESLIADRLESRCTFINKKDFSFKTLEQIIKFLIGDKKDNGNEKDIELREIVENELKRWKNERNKALHEMAKMEDGDSRTWDERVEGLKRTAKSGLTLVRKIDKRCKQLLKEGV